MFKNEWSQTASKTQALIARSLKFTFTYLTVNNVTGCKASRNGTSWLVIQLTLNVTAVVTVASYSASALSAIVSKTYELAFNSFEQFWEDVTYNLGVGKHGGHYTHFEVSIFLLKKIIDFSENLWDMTQYRLVLEYRHSPTSDISSHAMLGLRNFNMTGTVLIM
jgi:hypothetical protein